MPYIKQECSRCHERMVWDGTHRICLDCRIPFQKLCEDVYGLTHKAEWIRLREGFRRLSAAYRE